MFLLSGIAAAVSISVGIFSPKKFNNNKGNFIGLPIALLLGENLEKIMVFFHYMAKSKVKDIVKEHGLDALEDLHSMGLIDIINENDINDIIFKHGKRAINQFKKIGINPNISDPEYLCTIIKKHGRDIIDDFYNAGFDFNDLDHFYIYNLIDILGLESISNLVKAEVRPVKFKKHELISLLDKYGYKALDKINELGINFDFIKVNDLSYLTDRFGLKILKDLHLMGLKLDNLESNHIHNFIKSYDFDFIDSMNSFGIDIFKGMENKKLTQIKYILDHAGEQELRNNCGRLEGKEHIYGEFIANDFSEAIKIGKSLNKLHCLARSEYDSIQERLCETIDDYLKAAINYSDAGEFHLVKDSQEAQIFHSLIADL